ncbi:hypothetical protein ORI20_08315 [Mycobacterium sp. CVI_P3]|uniref:Secreted protein n=1 Tax=Mycobacterium pinniadriaticum TaxID=2994102 RepID=A0ABT3SAY5_9MYCO|nr:hypothetical protein [Mycobacterium pinniadriaticum]MCX2930276.1 hypothetical protein [Mycobacterium pinniadriaticum]MCX2936662.1 hypothetical protein [Mycobacterium pinniadriaticum]
MAAAAVAVALAEVATPVGCEVVESTDAAAGVPSVAAVGAAVLSMAGVTGVVSSVEPASGATDSAGLLSVAVAVGVEVVGEVVEAAVSVVLLAAVVVLLAARARPEPDDRTDNEEPLLEGDEGLLPVERLRAGPADGCARLELAEWLELLPELLAELAFDPESEEPPSMDAEATPCPTPTARPNPTAAARRPLRAARCRLRAMRLRWRAACFRWRPTRLLELTDSPLI